MADSGCSLLWGQKLLLWAGTHLMSLSRPCSPGWHCYSVGAAVPPLPICGGNRFISELFFWDSLLRESWFPPSGIRSHEQWQLQCSLPVACTAWCCQAMQMRDVFCLAPSRNTSTISKLSLGLSYHCSSRAVVPLRHRPANDPGHGLVSAFEVSYGSKEHDQRFFLL